MITFESKGSFKKTESFLAKMQRQDLTGLLSKYGQEGVAALSSATPVESGETASAWSYEVGKRTGSYMIIWRNSHIQNENPIAILIQYGHGTGTGGYVQGRDYINPAMRPIFDNIAERIWKEVTSA